MAEVEHAGITGTGATGEGVHNELPEVLKAYRQFRDDPVAFGRDHREFVQQRRLHE